MQYDETLQFRHRYGFIFKEKPNKRENKNLTRIIPLSFPSAIFQIHCFQFDAAGLPGCPLLPGEPGAPIAPGGPLRPGRPSLPAWPGTPGTPGTPGVPQHCPLEHPGLLQPG